MTILEIILAVSFGLFVVFAILVGIGAAVEQGNFLKRAKVAGRIAKSAEATARMWRRCLDEQSKAHRELDLKVGKATGRIRNAYLHERRLRRELDPESYYPGQGKQHGFIAQGLAEALKILEQETGRFKEEKEDPSPAYLSALTRRNIVRQSAEADRQRRQFVADQKRDRWLPTVPYPYAPPTDTCKVCGCLAYTWRWGQWVNRWDSESNVRSAFATVKWQEFDPACEVGWFPVCATHAVDLDGHGSIVVRRVGYHCG